MQKIIPKESYRLFANTILGRRYNNCNKNGHKEVINSVCNYCFRHYPQTEQQRITDRNKGLIILIDSLKELDLSK